MAKSTIPSPLPATFLPRTEAARYQPSIPLNVWPTQREEVIRLTHTPAAGAERLREREAAKGFLFAGRNCATTVAILDTLPGCRDSVVAAVGFGRRVLPPGDSGGRSVRSGNSGSGAPPPPLAVGRAAVCAPCPNLEARCFRSGGTPGIGHQFLG